MIQLSEFRNVANLGADVGATMVPYVAAPVPATVGTDWGKLVSGILGAATSVYSTITGAKSQADLLKAQQTTQQAATTQAQLALQTALAQGQTAAAAAKAAESAEASRILGIPTAQAVGGVALLGAVGVGAYLLLRRRRRR